MTKTMKDKKEKRGIVCTFCLDEFTPYETWWVDMKMHRDHPSCTSLYSVPSCEKCKDDPENSWLIVGISEEPKKKKVSSRAKK